MQLTLPTDHLSLMPAEIIRAIFCKLSSLSDVLTLSATCQRHRTVWTENIASIYNEVGPRSIICERHARRLLADLDGSPPEYPILSAKDVLCILRNSHLVENAILEFEKEVFNKNTEMFGVHRPDARDPPRITHNERPRFTRSFYQLWGIINQDTDQSLSRFKTMGLNQVLYVALISMALEKMALYHIMQDPTLPNFSDPLNFPCPAGHDSKPLDPSEISRMINAVFGRVIHYIWRFFRVKEFEGKKKFFNYHLRYLEDQGQGELKEFLCNYIEERNDDSTGSTSSSSSKLQLWEDSSDEET